MVQKRLLQLEEFDSRFDSLQLVAYIKQLITETVISKVVYMSYLIILYYCCIALG